MLHVASSGLGFLTATKPVKDYHTSINDRIDAAKRFIRECNYNSEVVCDTMANEVLDRYMAYPERICVIEKGIMVHDGAKRSGGGLIKCDVDEVSEWLRTRDTRNLPDSYFLTPATKEVSSQEEEEEEEEGSCSA